MLKSTTRLTLPLAIAIAALSLAYLGLRSPERQDQLEQTGTDLSARSAPRASSAADAPDGAAAEPAPQVPAAARQSTTVLMPQESHINGDEVVVEGDVAMIAEHPGDTTSAQESVSGATPEADIHMDPYTGTTTLSGATTTVPSPPSSVFRDAVSVPLETAPPDGDTDIARAPPDGDTDIARAPPE